VAAVSLMLGSTRAVDDEPGKRREDRRERDAELLVQRVPPTRLEAAEVLVDRIDEHPEGQVTFQLRCPAREHQLCALVGTCDQLRDEATLADPGFADQLERSWLALLHLGERELELAELLGAPDEVRGKHGHSAASTIDQGSRIEKSGCSPDVGEAVARQARSVLRYMLHHRHEPHECGVVFASFKGYESRLRRQMTLASCHSGGHAIWWTVEAGSEAEALGLLPFYVAERTTAETVNEVEIP
jgi:hypothetical protein